MKKHAIYPIIMSSFAIIGFIAALLLFSTAVQPPWLGVSFLILPAVLLGAVAFCAGKGKLSAVSTAVLTTVMAIVLLLASIFYSLILVWISSENVTDVRYYSRAYSHLDDVESVKSIFPKSIPSDAKDVKFSYSPQVLQGGETLKLSYTATEEKIAEWKTIFQSKAVWIGPNEEWHYDNNWSFSGEDATRYQIYWDGGFNHGEICYVLINEEMNKITFYYSNW